MSDFKLEFTLKQHTPLIHFQHDQEGATIRATEFKPAFDRYLIQKLMGQNDFNAAIAVFETHPEYRFWLVGKGNRGQPALDYSIQIYSKPQFHEIEIPKVKWNREMNTYELDPEKFDNFPGFFANLKKEGMPEGKHFSFSPEPVKVVFRSLHQNLLDKIASRLPAFLETNNFASRKTKGFGSFTEIERTPPSALFSLELDCYNLEREFDQKYKIAFPDRDAANPQVELYYEWKELFRKIDLFHRTLRSGYNNGKCGRNDPKGSYIKSPLFLFCKDELGIQWDKKSIKQKFFSAALEKQSNSHDASEILTYSSQKRSKQDHYYLIRDLLGLATESDWKHRDYYNDTKIKKENPKIDRLPSPVTYKPIYQGNGTYLVNILLNPVPTEVFGETFEITSTKHKDAGTLFLDFPDSGFFSLNRYFRYLCSDDFNINDLIGEGRNNPDTREIAGLFNQLKTNYQNQNPAE